MSVQEFEYTLTVTIKIRGPPTKKNTVRDALLTQLQAAKSAGNIEEAQWSLTGEVVPEGGKI